jgi:hypothetical protein
MNEYPSATTPTTAGTGTGMSQWDAYAERLRVQLPAAPEGLLNGYVKWAPWLSIIFGALGILGMIALLGLGAILGPFLLLAGSQGVQAGGQLFITLILGLLLAVAEVVGGVMMRNMRLTGWWILSVGLAINLVTGLLHGNALSLVISLLVAYVHLLVKPRYS